MLQQEYRIVLTGGESGGHVFPLMTVAAALRERLGERAQFLYVGCQGEFEKQACQEMHIPMKSILTGKWRRYFSMRNFLDIFTFLAGLFQALWHLLWYMPDAVFSKGGSVAVPVVLAAKLYRIPVLTHESDAVPGVANRILGKIADRVAVTYEMAKQYFSAAKTAMTGIPVRPEIMAGSAERARTTWRLHADKPVLLILGGSQGSQILNRVAIKVAKRLVEHFEVIHQTGERNFEETKKWLDEEGISEGTATYRLIPFLSVHELGDALAVAEMVLCRAGATQIAEIASVGHAAVVLVPLKNSANDHQRMNAYEVARAGGAFVLEETNLGENMLLSAILRLWQDTPVRAKMVTALKTFHQPEAATLLANGILGMIK